MLTNGKSPLNSTWSTHMYFITDFLFDILEILRKVKKLRARVLDTYVMPYVGPQGDIRCKLLF